MTQQESYQPQGEKQPRNVPKRERGQDYQVTTCLGTYWDKARTPIKSMVLMVHMGRLRSREVKGLLRTLE